MLVRYFLIHRKMSETFLNVVNGLTMSVHSRYPHRPHMINVMCPVMLGFWASHASSGLVARTNRPWLHAQEMKYSAGNTDARICPKDLLTDTCTLAPHHCFVGNKDLAE